MKRNMDLIRQILQKIEDSDSHCIEVHTGNIGNETRDVVAYHYHLLCDAGLLKMDPDFFVSDGERYQLTPTVFAVLTWKGHEFLDASRDPDVWKNAKDIAGKSANFSFRLLYAVLTDLALHKSRSLMGF